MSPWDDEAALRSWSALGSVAITRSKYGARPNAAWPFPCHNPRRLIVLLHHQAQVLKQVGWVVRPSRAYSSDWTEKVVFELHKSYYTICFNLLDARLDFLAVGG